MARAGKKRLAVDLPEALHMLLAEMANKYNVSITDYLKMLIYERLKQESEWDRKKYI